MILCRVQIGVDFALKVIQWSPDTVVRLQLWDIAGQERFGNMTRVYYKEAVGALVVFDVTRISTFDGVSKWKADIDEKVRLPDGSKIPVVLLANKVSPVPIISSFLNIILSSCMPGRPRKRRHDQEYLWTNGEILSGKGICCLV